MIIIQHTYHRVVLVACCFFCSVWLSACKKKDAVAPEKNTAALLADSIFLYAREVYLWNEQLPGAGQFNTGKYVISNDVLDHKRELFDITRFAVNPITGKSYEDHPFQPSEPKYSVIIGTGEQTSVADDPINTRLLSVSARFGINLVVTDDHAIYIKYVIKGSEAAAAGLKRGMRIWHINGKPVAANAAYYQYVQKVFSEATQLVLDGETAGNHHTYHLTYRRNNYFEPILKDTVLTQPSGRKVGYLAYLRFIDPNFGYKDLDLVMNDFTANNVSDVIIDLRYNGGGNLAELDRFANLLIPGSANGKIMRTERYNNVMKTGNTPLLHLQPLLGNNGLPVYLDGKLITYGDIDYTEAGNTTYFQKINGPGSLKKIYFIVSEETASAAELLISCLQPYVQTVLIGVSHKGAPAVVSTYGKPVGFFPLRIGPLHIYYSMFNNINARGEGDYYDGMRAALSVYDDPRYDLAESKEPGLEAALRLINGHARIAPRQAADGELHPGSWRNLNTPVQEPGIMKSYLRLKNGTIIKR
nr:S41 family peptidase [Chitinophaga nivalis]